MPKPMSMGHGRRTTGGGAEGGRPKADFSALGRAVKRLFVYYPRMAPLTMCCILFSAVVSAIPSLFTQNVIAVIERWYKTGDWAAARPEVLRYVTVLAVLYVLALISSTAYTQLMAVMTQGYLNKLRQETFGRMQDLPVRFFDTHQHGDIMSYYTNDIDTLRMLISQSLPTFIQSGSVVLVVFAIMLYFSLWMTLVLLVGVAAMFFVTKTVGGGSARYFVKQQQSLAETEGVIQEMMNGQKVVKVFCHEAEAIRDFDARNDALRENSRKANAYANLLGPIMNNIGNILYVVLALAGGVFLLSGVTNVSLSGKASPSPSACWCPSSAWPSSSPATSTPWPSRSTRSSWPRRARAASSRSWIRSRSSTRATSHWSMSKRTRTARSPRPTSAPVTGPGGIRTATAR